ncbi:MAG: SRPBCC domain-containing protein [Candidatus Marsarchaeota archaeon]|nr:SRPBCC domain-containing protein [Candidatus Marsarchaeota archaeon]
MEFSGKIDVNSPREKIFEYLSAPQKMASLIPGMQNYSIENNEIKMDVMVGLSFIKGKFKVKLKPLKLDNPSHVELKGSGSGAGSSIDFTATFDIKAITKASSEISWKAVVNVGGMAATFGSQMIKNAAQNFINQVIESLKNAAE